MPNFAIGERVTVASVVRRDIFLAVDIVQSASGPINYYPFSFEVVVPISQQMNRFNSLRPLSLSMEQYLRSSEEFSRLSLQFPREKFLITPHVSVCRVLIMFSLALVNNPLDLWSITINRKLSGNISLHCTSQRNENETVAESMDSLLSKKC